MPKLNEAPALSDSLYLELVDALHLFTTGLLLQFANASESLRRKIIRNFIARTQTTLDAISALWKLGHYSDGWALHRTMLDRLFHLHALAEKDEFERFERWSFMRQYRCGLRILGDMDIAPHAKEGLFVRTPEHDRRYQQLLKEDTKWSSPRAEEAAKSLGVSFLYRYGYDVGSRHVHPLADDGQREFIRLTHFGDPSEAGRTVLIGNSILVQAILIDEGLRATDLSWRRMILEFGGHIRSALAGEDDVEWRSFFVKIANAGESFSWCQGKEAGD